MQESGDSAAYRDQVVDIALGPKGAFQNGNIGTLTRRVPTDRVVSAVPSRRGKPKPPREPRTPMVVELLQKAIQWREFLDSGEVSSQAEIAHRDDLTRARVTQVMALTHLAPQIREYILSMPDVVRRPVVTERALRPITQIEDQHQQAEAFQALVRQD